MLVGVWFPVIRQALVPGLLFSATTAEEYRGPGAALYSAADVFAWEVEADDVLVFRSDWTGFSFALVDITAIVAPVPTNKTASTMRIVIRVLLRLRFMCLNRFIPG